ncbi:unnamed protein product [Pleuronectes platessa]|uniref:Uncharacterized protein n=1 Tax=Pleuronectes platessa TaxID=8262 RepID=A0A9N7TXY8_PLEPL|nr:unnamed protein product [Pleuronectes platessa]
MASLALLAAITQYNFLDSLSWWPVYPGLDMVASCRSLLYPVQLPRKNGGENTPRTGGKRYSSPVPPMWPDSARQTSVICTEHSDARSHRRLCGEVKDGVREPGEITAQAGIACDRVHRGIALYPLRAKTATGESYIGSESA